MSAAYEPPTFDAPVDLDLSRNEGRPVVSDVGMTPSELAAITSRYPDTTRLTGLVARRHGVPPSRVLVTAGGDDAISRCFLANAKRPVVATTPTFEMIGRYASQVGGRLIEVPWWEGDFPIDGFLDAAEGEAEMAVIVSPNNPTGNVVTEADLRKVSGAFHLVVLDAAYADFADEDLTAAALGLENVVVVRTLSKAFGLAGLRVGYLLGSVDNVARLGGYGSPYSMSALSAALAARVLERGENLATEFASEISDRRERLTTLLDELGCAPIPSQGNFVLCTDVDPDWLVPAAASLGVGLRRFGDRPDLARCVRITIPPDEAGYERLEETLRTALTPQALIFDMDGVIADVRDSYRTAIVATAAGFGVTVTPEDIASAKARGNASDDWELTRGLCRDAGVELSFDEVRDRFESIYQGEGRGDGLKLKERLLVDPADLETWSAGMALGIVTARPRKDANEFIERFDIAGYFATVITREDAPSKPDPAPVRLALERLGVERAWMLGDTVDDLTAARAAGVVPIGVNVPGDDPSALRGAARILSATNQIEEVLDVTKR